MENELAEAALAAIKEAEESKQQAPPGQDSSGESEVDKQIQQVERLAKADPDYAQSDEYKQLMNSLKGAANQTESDDDEEEQDDDDEENEDEQPEEAVDIFGLSKKPKKEKTIKADFKAPEELTKIIKENFGIKDVETFLNSTATWRQQAQEATEVRKENEAILNDLAAMPPEIKRAVNAWIEDPTGGNWIESITEQRLDWSASFEQQDVDGLAQHYFPDERDELIAEFESEAIDEKEFGRRMQQLAKTTRQLFNSDKKALESERAEYASRIQAHQKLVKDSALTSVSNLSKAYPHFTKSEMNKVRTTLVEGKLDDLFTNPDGSYKDDAAELVAYAMYGRKMAELLKKQGEKKGKSEANMELVDKSPKAIRKNKSNDAGGASKELIDAISHHKGIFKPRSIFD